MAESSAIPDALARTITSSVASLHSAVNTAVTVATTEAGRHDARSLISSLGRLFVALIGFLPGIVYRIITFSTWQLPTFLFTLFSTSLTFTMNATTLYVSHLDILIHH